MNVFVLFSGGASSLKAMLDDPNYGKLYNVAGALTDKKEARGRKMCADNGIPDIYQNILAYSREHGLDPANDNTRRKFYDHVVHELEQFKPDVIALSGYMRILPENFINAYVWQVLNVHPARLDILTDGTPGSRFDSEYAYNLYRGKLSAEDMRAAAKRLHLKRKFTGADPVFDAVVTGEEETRSTIHFVTKDVDGGPILVQSRPFHVEATERDKDARAYASALQETMKWEGDGPAYRKALEFIAKGRVAVDIGETVFLDGNPLPYHGYRLAA